MQNRSFAITEWILLWGSRIAAHPYVDGHSAVDFSTLLPECREFVELFRDPDSGLTEGCFDVLQLLAASKSFDPVKTLLSEGLISWERRSVCKVYGCFILKVRSCMICAPLIWFELYSNCSMEYKKWTLKTSFEKNGEEKTVTNTCAMCWIWWLWWCIGQHHGNVPGETPQRRQASENPTNDTHVGDRTLG